MLTPRHHKAVSLFALGIAIPLLYWLPFEGGLPLLSVEALVLAWLCTEEVQGVLLRKRCLAFSIFSLASVGIYECGGPIEFHRFIWVILFSYDWHCRDQLFASSHLLSRALLSMWITVPFHGIFGIIFHAPSLFVARRWIFFLLVTVKGGSIVAYLTRRLWRGHRWIPEINPNRTLESNITALAWSLCVGLGFGWWYNNMIWYMGLGLALSTMGQWGEVIESIFKESARSHHGSTLPGVSSVLDCVGSLSLSSVLLSSINLS